MLDPWRIQFEYVLNTCFFSAERVLCINRSKKSDDLHAFHELPFTYPSFPRHLRVRRHREEQCFGYPEITIQHSAFAFALTSPGALALLQAKNEITINISRRKLVLYRISRRRALFSASRSLNPYVDMDSSFFGLYTVQCAY